MIHNLTAWRSERKERSRKVSYREWNALHLEELFSLLKSIEEGRGSVVIDPCGVTISAGCGVEATFRDDGTVCLGDKSCSVIEKVHFKKNKCFALLDRSTLLRFLGLLFASVADGMGFVEWSAGQGIIYSDVYTCWAVFSSDGGVEFNRLFQAAS
jgi:hypothetical protein